MNHKKWIVVMTLTVAALILTHLPVLETTAAAQGNSFSSGTVSGNAFNSVSTNGINSASVNTTGNVIGSTVVVGNHAVVMLDPGTEKVRQGYTESEAAMGGQDIVAVTEDGKIPEWEYYRNPSLNGVTIPEGTTEINRFAFARSSVKNISFPEGITTIDYAAFYHCDDLKSVVLPGTVTKVGAKAFAHTGWMDDFEENSMDDFLISGDILVAYKGDLPEVTIPGGVRVIADEVFREHTEIKKVHLPASVAAIGDSAFPEGIEIINE